MQRVGDLLTAREPTAEEAAVLRDVVEVAEAWQSGGIDLFGVRTVTSGYERWQAMRFAATGSDQKRAVLALVNALVEDDPTGIVTPFGVMGLEEMHAPGVKRTTNHAGQRVYVWPLASIEGDAVYPRTDLAPGEERRAEDTRAVQAYEAYRKRRHPFERGGRS